MMAPPPVAASSKSGVGPQPPPVAVSSSARSEPQPPPAAPIAASALGAAAVRPAASAPQFTVSPAPLSPRPAAVAPPPPAPFPGPAPTYSQGQGAARAGSLNWKKVGSIAVLVAVFVGSTGLRWFLRSTRSSRWSTPSKEAYKAAGAKRERAAASDPDKTNFRADDQTILIVKHTNDLEVANACVEFWRVKLRRKLTLLSTKDALFEEGQFGVMPAHHGAVEIVGPKTWPKSQAEALTLHLSERFGTLAVHTWDNDFSGEWLFTACENGQKKFHADMSLKGRTLADAEETVTTEGNEWATSHGYKPGPEGFTAFDEEDADRILKKLGIKLWDRKDESFSYALKQ
jgi:hypothetical protein